MHFLLDENVSPRLKEVLSIIFRDRHDFKNMKDHGLCGKADQDWIPVVAKFKPKPVLITIDAKMRKKIVEQEVLKQSGLTTLMLHGFGEMRLPEQTWRLIRMFPEIEKSIKSHPGQIMIMYQRTVEVPKYFERMRK